MPHDHAATTGARPKAEQARPMKIIRMKGSPRWYVEWWDHRRKRHRWPAHTDRRASEVYGEQLERIVSTVSVGLRLDARTVRWIGSLKPSVQRNLARIGLIDFGPLAAVGPLDAHIAAFKRHLQAKECTPQHVAGAVRHCRQALTAVNAASIDTITAQTVSEHLKGYREAGASYRTSNHRLASLKAFCNWAVRERYADRNPLAHLSKLPEAVDRRNDHAPFDRAELAALLSATRAGPVRAGCCGEERYWIYRLAAETGFRAGELRSLRVRDFDLGSEPSVTVRAAFSRKRKRSSTLPLRDDTASGLREFLATGLPEAAAFAAMPRQTAKVLAADCEAAGIEVQVDDTKRHTFHAMRHTFITEASYTAASFADLQALARHGSPELTARYTHARLSSMRAAIEGLPGPAANARKQGAG